MILTDEERLKFIKWLKSSSESDAKLAEQCDLIGEKFTASKLRLEAVAANTIADKLIKTEINAVTIKEG